MRSQPPQTAKPLLSNKGFTMLELSLVMSVIGLMSLVALASFQNFKHYAERAACVTHQRSMMTPAILYGFENSLADVDINSTVLLTANLIEPALGECPVSVAFDSADYLLIYQNGELADVECLVVGLLHPFER